MLRRVAVNPKTGKIDFELTLSYNKLVFVVKSRQNVGDKKTVLHTIGEVLTKPCALFEGIRFDEDEKHSCNAPGWLCYCGKPEKRYKADGSSTTVREDMVFLVFVNEERIIYNWTWEKVDLDLLSQKRQYLPVDHEQRFLRQIF
jgi:hypothetical protein